MAIFLFDVVYSFEVSVQVVPNIIPRVTRVVDIFISPWVGEVDLTRVGPNICECVQYVPVVL